MPTGVRTATITRKMHELAARTTEDRTLADELIDPWFRACAIRKDHADTAAAASVAALVERHARYRATGPLQIGARPAAIHLVFVAAAVGRTSWLPLPDVGGIA